jgi:hypothetical protein
MDFNKLQSKLSKLDRDKSDKEPTEPAFYVDPPEVIKPARSNITRNDCENLMDEIFNFGKEKSKQRSAFDDIYDKDYKKKKKAKKKKSKKTKYTNFRAMFERDLSQLNALVAQQHKFTDDLQKKYEESQKTKSSYRGITKFETDLIQNITSARTLELHTLDRIANTKKAIADLNAREKKDVWTFETKKKEMAGVSESDDLFTATIMSNLLNNRKQLSASSLEVDDDIDYGSMLKNSIGEGYKPTKEIEYESHDIERIVETFEDGSYKFKAYDNTTGNYIDDYPDPPNAKLRFIEDRGIAKDEYGAEYKWEKN